MEVRFRRWYNHERSNPASPSRRREISSSPPSSNHPILHNCKPTTILCTEFRPPDPMGWDPYIEFWSEDKSAWCVTCCPLQLQLFFSPWVHSEFLPSTWSFRTSLLIIGWIFWSKCHFGSFLGTGTLRKDSSTCQSTPSAGSLCCTCYAVQVHHRAFDIQRRCLAEQLLWSKIDLFLSVFQWRTDLQCCGLLTLFL